MPISTLFEKINEGIVVSNTQLKVWILDLTIFCDYVEELRFILPEREKLKAESINKPHLQNLFVLRKGLTRMILSQELHKSPEELYLAYDEKRKPYVLNETIYFNVSHSAEYLMLGISQNGEVGVDIQKKRIRTTSLLENLYSQSELKVYQNVSPCEKEEFFWKTFVWKESLTKAVGDGMTRNFNGIYVVSSNIDNVHIIHYSDEITLKSFCYGKVKAHYAYSISQLFDIIHVRK